MTSLLTRDEMHKRVDALFDSVEENEGGEAIAVVGGLAGNMKVSAPSENKDYHRIRGTLGFASYAFDDAWPVGQAARNSAKNNLLGTLVVSESDVSDIVADGVLEGVEEAREAMAKGEPEQYEQVEA